MSAVHQTDIHETVVIVSSYGFSKLAMEAYLKGKGRKKRIGGG